MSVLEVANLGKSYRRYASELLRVGSWFGLPAVPVQEDWVLRQISFSVSPGETVGIVGQNGAGKSTLLKVITSIQSATEGFARIHGRVSAILELGMGFNPEFTGRQNAFHGLGLMGFTPADVERIMPEVEAFAEIDGYFDASMRTYSSGMQMRVAFAVATAFRPDLLIVDEALSVGDAYFQHKCIERIRQMRDLGTALLIVSHDSGTILALCDRAILLESGMVVQDGAPEAVMDYYNARLSTKGRQTVRQEALPSGRVRTSSGTGEATIESARLLDRAGHEIELVQVGEEVSLEITSRSKEALDNLTVGFSVRNRLGIVAFGTNTFLLNTSIGPLAAGQRSVCRFVFPANLGAGTYSISIALHGGRAHIARNYDWRDIAVMFEVASGPDCQFDGVAWLHPRVEVAT